MKPPFNQKIVLTIGESLFLGSLPKLMESFFRILASVREILCPQLSLGVMLEAEYRSRGVFATFSFVKFARQPEVLDFVVV